jgi:hypothetical protein
MPVSFLSAIQRENYGRYAGSPTSDELTRFFHLTDDDLAQIMTCRGAHNRMGFALQLTTVRYLGTFLDNPLAVPPSVMQTLARQLPIADLNGLPAYLEGERRWDHVASIRAYYGYSDITEPRVGFRLSRWLFALCWTGTERPSVLFDRATTWLLAHKILARPVAAPWNGSSYGCARESKRVYGVCWDVGSLRISGPGCRISLLFRKAAAPPRSTRSAQDRHGSAGRPCVARSSA